MQLEGVQENFIRFKLWNTKHQIGCVYKMIIVEELIVLMKLTYTDTEEEKGEGRRCGSKCRVLINQKCHKCNIKDLGRINYNLV
ncbi:hypothetical protein ECG_06127 [Echinococcus granulosus]|uniref:Expressed protein n=1 Tax=Echinococcus granulosus TaxID=6210 RepID=A0A068WQ87_ECHGR|nr:hypothetical protein ECG_06127 [Echinococcus granulosus]CDS19799.1 expressed protein [Echinococcus granulosus]